MAVLVVVAIWFATLVRQRRIAGEHWREQLAIIEYF